MSIFKDPDVTFPLQYYDAEFYFTDWNWFFLSVFFILKLSISAGCIQFQTGLGFLWIWIPNPGPTI